MSWLKICSKGKFSRRNIRIPSKAQNFRLFSKADILFPRFKSWALQLSNNHFKNWKQGGRDASQTEYALIVI
jgi:hypothetical protein